MRKLRRLATFRLIVAAFVLMAIPLVSAECETGCGLGCAHTIKVIPVGSTRTGEPDYNKRHTIHDKR